MYFSKRGLAPLLILATVAGSVAGLTACGTTKTVVTPGPTVTQTQQVPGPVTTQTVPAPPPPQGSVIDTFHGTGNNVTPEFNVPSDGNYIVTWTFSDNGDGFGNGDNFIVNNTGDGDGSGLANDIAVSGHGSGEVQGAGSTDSLTVQAADSASWTLTVKSD
jgi:hypothetical protein